MLNDFYRRDIYYLFLKEVKFDDIDKIFIIKYNVVMWLLEVFDYFIICKLCRYCFFVIYMQIYFGGVFLFQKVILNFIVLIILDGSLFFLVVVRFGVK